MLEDNEYKKKKKRERVGVSLWEILRDFQRLVEKRCGVSEGVAMQVSGEKCPNMKA